MRTLFLSLLQLILVIVLLPITVGVFFLIKAPDIPVWLSGVMFVFVLAIEIGLIFLIEEGINTLK